MRPGARSPTYYPRMAKHKHRFSMRDALERFSKAITQFTGSSTAFGLALAIIVVWGITGPLFGFSDTWQLVINTGTTIVTFLMVFLIQNTQTRDARAIHLKLDELIRSTNAARNRLIDLEECSDEELDRIKREFDRLKAHPGLDRGDKGSGKVGEPEQRRDSVDG
jgi:low affinity Fe/Cu permease